MLVVALFDVGIAYGPLAPFALGFLPYNRKELDHIVVGHAALRELAQLVVHRLALFIHIIFSGVDRNLVLVSRQCRKPFLRTDHVSL
ncbi:hypothetical protein D3C81_1341580 [compost metagenome]